MSDDSGISQEPRFSIQHIRKWTTELYKMVIKAKATTQENISEKEVSQMVAASCFNCGRWFEIYDLIICDHCITSFCNICLKKHEIEPEAKFDAKYLGGYRAFLTNPQVPRILGEHKVLRKHTDTKVFVFSDRVEVEEPKLRIPYNSINNIENADEKKVSALRVVG